MTRITSRNLIVLTIAAALLFTAGMLQAATLTFDNDAADFLWRTATNWDDALLAPPGDPALIPGAGDDAEIFWTDTAEKTVVIKDGAAGNVGSLKIGSDTEFNVNLTAGTTNTASSVTFDGDVTVGGSGTGATDIMTGKKGTLTFAGDIISNSVADHEIQQNNGNLSSINVAGNILANANMTEIDLLILNGSVLEPVLLTGGAQTLDLGNLQIANAADNRDLALTLGGVGGFADTLTAHQASIIGQNTKNSGTIFTTKGTLNIVDSSSATFESTLVLGNITKTPDDGETQIASGIINVGDGATAGTLTVNGKLSLALANNGAGVEDSTGKIVINHENSVVTIAREVVRGSGPLIDSRIQMIAGTLKFTSTVGTDQRAVKTFDFDNGTMEMKVFSGSAPLQTVDTTLGDGTAGHVSTIDINTAGVAVGSLVDTATFDNDNADGVWATAANWSADALPDNIAIAVANGGVYPILTANNVITNNGLAVLDAVDAAAGWALDQTTTKIDANYSGVDILGGPGVAIIDTSVTVTRAADLHLENAGLQGADASQLDISDGTLDLTTGASLILGGPTAAGDVDQTGGAVVIDGIIKFGTGGAADKGGNYRLEGGTLTVNGTSGGDSVAVQHVDMTTGGLFVDGGSLVVAGDINIRTFRIADSDGSTGAHTLDSSKNIDTSDAVYVARSVGSNGTLTVDSGSAVTVGTSLNLGGASSTALVVANGGNITTATTLLVGDQLDTTLATLTVNSGSVVTVGTNLKFGGGENSTTVFNLDGGDVSAVGQLNLGDGKNHTATAHINSGTLGSDGTFYVGDDTSAVQTALSTLNIGVGFGAPDITLGGDFYFAHHSNANMTMDSGTLTATDDFWMSHGDEDGQAGVATINGGKVTIGDDLVMANASETGNGNSAKLYLVGGTLEFLNFNTAAVSSAFNNSNETGNLFQWTGGTLTGLSSFEGDLVQGDADAIDPASTAALEVGNSVGILNVSDTYTLNSDGTVEIEIEGTAGAGVDPLGHDQITVTNAAVLNGEIDLVLVGDFQPLLGDTFVYLTSGTDDITGSPTIDLSAAVLTDGSLSWDVSTLGTAVVVPEPGTMVLLAVGGVGMLLRRRKRKIAA